MTQFLPPNLLALFAPREPIPYLPPPDKLPHEKKQTHNYVGIASFVEGNFEDPADTPAPVRIETRDERLERKKREKAEQVAYKLEQEIALWDPHSLENGTTDPFKTLFVGRINYYTSESKLRREFESYGPIKTIFMPKDNSDKPRGFCFIEYEHERDMHSAYKHADGKKIDGRRVLVDVERARTVKGWLPRRLGGGLGGTRRGGPDVNVLHSGREDSRRDRRSRSRERRSRSRDRDRDRDRRRGDRGGNDRDRDRDRDRRRSRSRDRKRSRREDRSRSRDRDRERSRRSRSRDRKRSRREDRSRDRDRERRRRDRGEENIQPKVEWDPENNGNGVPVKEEPQDYNDYSQHPDVKQEPEDYHDMVDRKPNINTSGYEDDRQY